MEEEFEESSNSIIADDEIVEKGTCDSRKYHLDITEPANSLLRYFEYLRGDKIAKCRVCMKKISRKYGNTSGMKRHLMIHRRLYKEFLSSKSVQNVNKLKEERPTSSQSSAQSTISNFIEQKQQKWETTHHKSKLIDEAILRFICLSAHPLSLTEQSGFEDMISILCPSYKLKSREYMTELLSEKYKQKYLEVKSSLQLNGYFSFTTDLWQSKNKKKSFLSVTCHFIDENFNRCWKLIGIEPVFEEHTALTISNKIDNVLNDFSISPSQVHIFMRDAASSMKKAIEDLNYQNFDCFLHKIALAVNDATEHRTKAVGDVKKQIQICRELVAFYNRSSEFQRTLLRQQQLIDAPKTF